MTAEDGIKYETRTVKAVRGMESRTTAKWEAQGWEVVSQTAGRISTELTIRRPKPKPPWLVYAGLGGVIVVLFIVILVMNLVTGSDDAETEPSSTPSQSETVEASPEPSEPPSQEPTTDPTPDAPAVITVENSSEFAALVQLTDTCSPDIATFASAHAGNTIEFDGNIGAMNPHDGATTRYDILIGAGDFSETSAPGPNFQYRDVNTSYDLQWAGETPDAVGVGDNLHFVAEVGVYEASSCLFLLEPVETSAR